MKQNRRINFEINPTLRCNLKCPNCNRLCHLTPKWANDSDMTVEQVERFVAELRGGPVQAKRVKVAGGEPLLHPELGEILGVLLAGVTEGLIEKIKIDSNGTLPKLHIEHPALRWSGRKPAKKVHLPTLWSPTDLNLPTSYPCSMPKACGISLDNRGYLPCSMAISLVRTGVVGPEHYCDTFNARWNFHEICPHCVFAAPEAWRKAYCKPLNKITSGEKLPTATWAEALQYAES